MGFVKNTINLLERVGKGFGALAKPIETAIKAPFAILGQGVSEIKEGVTGTPQKQGSLERDVFGGTKRGSKARAGAALAGAGEVASVVPVGRGATLARTLLKQGAQGAVVGSTIAGGTAVKAGDKNPLSSAALGAGVGLTLGVAVDGVRGIFGNKYMKDALKDFGRSQLDKALPQARFKLEIEEGRQFREGMEFFAEKVQEQYPRITTLKGFIKKADADIVKWGGEYRDLLKNKYKDTVIQGDDVIGTALDTFEKRFSKQLTPGQEKTLIRELDKWKIRQLNSPEAVLDARQGVASEISSATRRAVERGEPVSDKYEVLLAIEEALNDMLQKMNPEDAALNELNKKMSFAFKVRDTAAAQRVALKKGKTLGTVEQMGLLDKLLTKTVLSTPLRKGYSQVALGLSRIPATPGLATQVLGGVGLQAARGAAGAIGQSSGSLPPELQGLESFIDGNNQGQLSDEELEEIKKFIPGMK